MANDIKTFGGYLGTYHMVGKADYEPQRTNNFEVYIDFGSTPLTTAWNGNQIESYKASGIITLSVSSFTPPSPNISSIQIKRGNNTIKYAGTPEFPDSPITFNDYIGLDVEEVLMAWQKLAYNVRTQAIGLAANYKKTAWVNQYSPDGTQVRQWVIEGAWLSTINLGEYNSEDNSVRKVSGTIVYDYAYPDDDTSRDFSALKNI